MLEEKVKAEDRPSELAEEKGMPFTIVRPGGLKTEKATGTAPTEDTFHLRCHPPRWTSPASAAKCAAQGRRQR